MGVIPENTLDTRLAVTLLDYLYKDHSTNDEVMIDKQTGKLYYKKPDGVIIPCSSDSDNTAVSNVKIDIINEMRKNLDFSEIDTMQAEYGNMMTYNLPENTLVFDNRAFVTPVTLTSLIDTDITLSSVAMGLNVKLRPDDYRLVNIWKNIHLDQSLYTTDEDKYDYSINADVNGSNMKMNGNFGEMNFFNSIPSFGLWSTSGNMLVSTSNMGSAGLQDSAISAGGIENSANTIHAYKFNGIDWKVSVDLPVAIKDAVSIGIPTNSILVGGYTTTPLSTARKFNGEVWVSIENTLVTRTELSGCGNSASAMITGGKNTVTTLDTTEQYDGVVWSTSINMNIPKRDSETVGRLDDCISMGGSNTPVLANVEKFNGVVWYNTSNMNIARTGFGASGERDNALVFGPTGSGTEILKSDSWFIGMSQLASRTQAGSGGNSTHTLSFGGSPVSLFSEKFTRNNKLELDKTWSIYGMQVFNRFNGAGVGSQTSALSFGGKTDTIIKPETERFNGSIWTLESNTVSNRYENTGIGTSEDAINMGGLINETLTNTTEKFNGSIWSESQLMNSNRKSFAGCGVASAMVISGGKGVSELNTTEVFMTDTWTSKGNMLYAKSEHSMFGVYDNAIEVSGKSNDIVVETCAIFNGLTWSAKNGLNSPAYNGASVGTSNNGIFFGGNTDTEYNRNTEKFNGTIWQVNPSQLNYLRHGLSASGQSDIGLSFGGDTNKGYTEKFDGFTWRDSWLFTDTSTPFKLKGISINKWKSTIIPVDILEKIIPVDGEIRITDIDFTVYTKAISNMDIRYNPVTSMKIENIINSDNNTNDNFIQIVDDMNKATGQIVFLKKGEISI